MENGTAILLQRLMQFSTSFSIFPEKEFPKIVCLKYKIKYTYIYVLYVLCIIKVRQCHIIIKCTTTILTRFKKLLKNLQL